MTDATTVFSQAEIEQFITDGFVMLRGGFSRAAAAAGRAFIWRELGLPPDDPAAWREPIVHIQRNFRGAPFDDVLGPRLRAACAALMGPGRGVVHDFFGWWPVLFPGFPGPGGWHVDGSHFHHRLTSPEQGLVTLYLFSEIAPGGGGTALFLGSQREVARILAAAEPSGLSHSELAARLPPVDPQRVCEVIGAEGDVAFLHPFLIHGFGANRGARVRFACNPQYSLGEPMQLERADDAHSPVEEAIRRALRSAA